MRFAEIPVAERNNATYEISVLADLVSQIQPGQHRVISVCVYHILQATVCNAIVSNFADACVM